MSTPAQLLLATTSTDKIRELRQLFAHLPIQLLTLRDVGIDFDVEETGRTFRENAELKARAYFAAARLPCLAEDAGFEVDALGGAPGVYSARWEGTDYVHKNHVIVQRLAGLEGVARRCRYVCELALVGRDGRLRHARGVLLGRVAHAPAGRGGFGYDPIFELPRLHRTLAQLSDGQKHAVSHRGRAVRRLLPTIERLLLRP